MNRKDFLKNGLMAIGGFAAAQSFLAACRPPSKPWDGSGPCPISPEETNGPFPTHSPAELVAQNIVGDRKGVALRIDLTIKRRSNDCKPFPGAIVDIWHCDAHGDYSEYGGGGMQKTDHKNEHFLRGRQTTNAEWKVSYTSIFPGWYMDRAPHIHVEVFSAEGNSLLITQIAFPKDICDAVYATDGYKGPAEMSNDGDNVFADSLAGNMADSVTGDIVSGYTLSKSINV